MRSTTFIAVGIFSGLFSHQPPSSAAESKDNAPVLSAYSTGIARALPRTVTATLFFSKDLPPEFGPAEKATRALLKQYQAANPARFKISAVDPASAPGSLQKGACAIFPLHFRASRDEDGRDVPVYLGLCLQDGSNNLIVPDVSFGTVVGIAAGARSGRYLVVATICPAVQEQGSRMKRSRTRAAKAWPRHLERSHGTASVHHRCRRLNRAFAGGG
jgi:hypothetical protein